MVPKQSDFYFEKEMFKCTLSKYLSFGHILSYVFNFCIIACLTLCVWYDPCISTWFDCAFFTTQNAYELANVFELHHTMVLHGYHPDVYAFQITDNSAFCSKDDPGEQQRSDKT